MILGLTPTGVNALYNNTLQYTLLNDEVWDCYRYVPTCVYILFTFHCWGTYFSGTTQLKIDSHRSPNLGLPNGVLPISSIGTVVIVLQLILLNDFFKNKVNIAQPSPGL